MSCHVMLQCLTNLTSGRAVQVTRNFSAVKRITIEQIYKSCNFIPWGFKTTENRRGEVLSSANVAHRITEGHHRGKDNKQPCEALAGGSPRPYQACRPRKGLPCAPALTFRGRRNGVVGTQALAAVYEHQYTLPEKSNFPSVALYRQ